MSGDAFGRYLELIKKVDAFSRSVLTGADRHIACRRGCDDCCRNSFTVYRVEAQNLMKGFGLLGPTEKKLVMDNCRGLSGSKPGCVLLYEGGCLLYDYRPVICRTHGLPLISGQITIKGSRVTAICDKNFNEPGALDALPPELILNLDTLNAVLGAINMLYMKEPGDKPEGERVAIPYIFRP